MVTNGWRGYRKAMSRPTDQRGRGRLPLLQRTLIVGVLAILAAAGYPVWTSQTERLGGEPPPRKPRAGSAAAFACVRGIRLNAANCAAPVVELATRLRLTRGEQVTLANQARSALDAVDAAPACTPSDRGGSARQGADECLVAGESTPEQIRRVLDDAGYRGGEVRLAWPGDPAPVGSVFFAVPVGDGCLLGYTGSGARRWVTGRLLNGECATPPHASYTSRA